MTMEIRAGRVPSQRMQQLMRDGHREQELEKVGRGRASEPRAARDPHSLSSSTSTLMTFPYPFQRSLHGQGDWMRGGMRQDGEDGDKGDSLLADYCAHHALLPLRLFNL